MGLASAIAAVYDSWMKEPTRSPGRSIGVGGARHLSLVLLTLASCAADNEVVQPGATSPALSRDTADRPLPPVEPATWTTLYSISMTPSKAPMLSLNDIAIDDEYVFIAESSGAIVRVPKVGGAPLVIHPGSSSSKFDAMALAVDDTHVYWVGFVPPERTEDAMVRRAPKAGGAIEILAKLPAVNVALTSTDAYVLVRSHEESAVVRIPKGGGTVVTYPLPGRSIHSMITYGDELFLTATAEFPSPDCVFYRLQSGARAIEPIECPPFVGGELAVDDRCLYSINGDGDVFCTPKVGGRSHVIGRYPLGYPSGVVADAESLYWAAVFSLTRAMTVYLLRVPKSGGSYSLLVSEDSTDLDHGLAVDDERIYWLSPSEVRARLK